MKVGAQRFYYWLDRLEPLMKAAGASGNPAKYLYENKARDPLFMLEALCRIYVHGESSRLFKKLLEAFKPVEDLIGLIDYYDFFIKAYSGNNLIPAEVFSYCGQMRDKAFGILNELLHKKKWLRTDGNDRINKIKSKLSKTDWLKQKADIRLVESIYKLQISEVENFVRKKGLPFTELEAQVHELRRDLRWLSIYPQALRGSIQFTNDTSREPFLDKYLTPEIINSPFNVLPDIGGNFCFLLLHKKYYLALSWMIAELGKLKDRGLNFLILSEALEKTKVLTSEKVPEAAAQMLGMDVDPVPELLKQASDITAQYISENCLGRLMGNVYIHKFENFS